MPSSSPCLCCRCKHEISHSHQPRKNFLSPRGTTPETSSSVDHRSQERAEVDLAYEPIDPFKPSITYSLRHIFPSKTPPSSDPDPVVAALLSPCIALSASLSSKSQSSRRNSPHPLSDKGTHGHIYHSSWTDAPSHSTDALQPATPRTRQFADSQHRLHYAQRSAHAPRRSPHPHAPSPGLHSPSERLGTFPVPRSENSHESAQPQIAIEEPDDTSHTPRTPGSFSESVMSDFVRSYSQDLSSNGSPTLFSGSVRSGLPPIKEVDDFTPTAPQVTVQISTVHPPNQSPRAYSIFVDDVSKVSPDPSNQSHEGVSLSIHSDRLYTAPRLHSPPKARRKLCQVTSSTGESLKVTKVLHRGLKTQHQSAIQNPHDASKPASTFAYILAFIIDTVPRQLYLYLMLCIPYMYFSRVSNIFEEAELSLPRIKRGIIEAAYNEKERALIEVDNHMPAGAGIAADIHRAWRFEAPSTPSIAYFNLQKSWETFVDSLMSEWQTLNIISVLLMSAIIAILQISAPANDAATRYLALSSLICALLSLIYGCVYIIRFGSMKKAFKAAMWAAEAQRSTTCLLWNVWVFLAMPATWLAWSMILFIACIMSFIWRTGTIRDHESITITLSEARLPRIAITAILSIGVIYFVFIMRTLRRYGNAMDKKWHRTVSGWISAHQQLKFVSSTQASPHFLPSRHSSFHRPRTPTGRRFWPRSNFTRSTSIKSSWYV